MNITFGTTPYSNWQNLAPLLDALGCTPVEGSQPENWGNSSDPTPDGRLLLAYTAPMKALVNAMEQGTPPAEALEHWAGQAQALVNLFKANRRTVLLVDIDEVNTNPTNALKTIATHWQLDIEKTSLPESNDPNPANPHYSAIASIAVQQSAELALLLNQLEVCTLPLAEENIEGGALDVNTLYAELNQFWQNMEEHRALAGKHQALVSEKNTLEKRLTSLQAIDKEQGQKLEAQTREITSLQEESQLLLEQLHLVQEELEQKVLAAKEADKQHAALQAQQEKAEQSLVTEKSEHEKQRQAQHKELQSLKSQHSNLKGENLQLAKERDSLITAQKSKAESLKSTQEQLKAEQTAHTKTRSEKATLENQFKALKAQNKKQAENTEKLESQLKVAEQQHQQVQANLAEENQLLLEQLHLVQEELESKFLQVRDQDKGLANLQAQLERTARENQLLQQRLQKLRAGMEELERTSKAQNGNLAELKNQLAAAKKHQADWEHKCQQAEKQGTLALAYANRRITELSNELNQITKSTGWRLTNPGSRKKNKKAAADKLEQQIKQVEKSGLFDKPWYLETYPDVAKAKLNPVEHYLKTGAYEGRNPSETFDTTWYLMYYQDVTESGLNPLVHYIRFGQQEQRAPRPGALASLPAPQPQSTVEG